MTLGERRIKMELKINEEKTFLFLVGFLRDTVKAAGFERAVVGLSGGVDSSLSCILATEALGPANVLGILMPYRTSRPESVRHAEMVADRLGIATMQVDITPQVDAYFESFKDADRNRRGNKMARERMSILYDQSAVFNGLVVGTSNRTEILLGYGTLYGDTACAVNPIGGLYKTQVFALARYGLVPEEIVSKAPSADLWEGQTDENELGFTYFDVDRLLHHMVDEKVKDLDLERMGFERRFIDKVRGMVSRFAFKSLPSVIARIPPEVHTPEGKVE
jgi:NAD+ synthase